jgi:hypothetical protein
VRHASLTHCSAPLTCRVRSGARAAFTIASPGANFCLGADASDAVVKLLDAASQRAGTAVTALLLQLAVNVAAGLT